MILRRLGRKTKIAPLIYSLFPPHRVYVELFFEGGGMFFTKPKAPVNILNDLDDEVFNLFCVLQTRREELERVVSEQPMSTRLMKFYAHNHLSECPIQRAARFMYLSNYGLFGDSSTMRIDTLGNNKKRILSLFEPTIAKIQDCTFLNFDFRGALKKIGFSKNRDTANVFVYADPPYIGTKNNYETPTWKIQDLRDLCEVLVNSGFKFAISEFNTPEVLEVIGERRNINNRRVEILATNYKTNQLSMF